MPGAVMNDERNEFYGDLPVLKAGKESTVHLATGDLNPGCWLKGKTVKSPITCGGKTWDAYSVPVFAYLVSHPLIALESVEGQKKKVKVTQGFSSTFTQHIEAGLSIEAKGMGAEMKVSFDKSDTWSSSSEIEIETEFKGGENYYPYQLHVVYAHWLLDASEVDEYFSPFRIVMPVVNEHQQVLREDLYFLSSVATQTVQHALADTEVEELEWEEIQQYVLAHFDAGSNEGKWSFEVGQDLD